MNITNAFKISRLIIFVMSFSFLFITNVSAQDRAATQTASKIKSAEWQPLLSNEFVDIKYRYAECNQPHRGTYHENVYLSFSNKTTKSITVEWISENYYNNRCIPCENPSWEYLKKIMLAPGETIEGNCDSQAPKELKIHSKMIDIEHNVKLTDFNLGLLKITETLKESK